MPHYDLCLAWNWEYDRDFVHMLESACVRVGLIVLLGHGGKPGFHPGGACQGGYFLCLFL